MTKQQHQSTFSWLLLPMVIVCIFFWGALMESVFAFDVVRTGLMVGGYMILTGLVTLWWQIKVKD